MTPKYNFYTHRIKPEADDWLIDHTGPLYDPHGWKRTLEGGGART